MENNLTRNQNRFILWSLISLLLIIIFIQYGKKLKKQSNSQEKAIKKIGWTITITILVCIYITEQTIPNTEERRLINSMIIFAGTFSYLYCLQNHPFF